MSTLLSVSADAKTVKGEKQGYLTGILYLAPHTVAGVGNLCPNASPACIAACLNTAGRGVFTSVQQGRIRKTRAFHADRETFMRELARDIAALVRKAKRTGMVPVVRLNGTSDIPWENIRPVPNGRNIMESFPDVQFYDYTKSHRRMVAFCEGKLPANYHLTFSRSECNEAHAMDVLARGGNVAVVFSTRKGQELPWDYKGIRVVDGDGSDARFADGGAPQGQASIGQSGVVVGLRAKGRARKDAGGFVVQDRVPCCRYHETSGTASYDGPCGRVLDGRA